MQQAQSTEIPNSEFHYRIEARPDFALLTVSLPAGKTLKVEASAMASMDSNLRMKTRMKGGLSRLFTGESLFINEFTAEGGAGEISIAPGSPGDIEHINLRNETVYLQNSAYLASSPQIELETKWQGVKKGFFSGESFFLIKASGTGDLWFNTYGAMIELPEGNSSVTVDTGHIVAFTEGLTYEVGRLGGYKSLFLSGEGFVCRFSGKGRIWIQTRKAEPLVRWLHWYRPVKSKD
jgi:uncharacterized protein (TIGR00266 family)